MSKHYELIKLAGPPTGRVYICTSGSGRFALLAWCDVLTVTLHETSDRAEAAKKVIDERGCGHACSGKHKIVEMEHCLKEAVSPAPTYDPETKEMVFQIP